MLVAKRPPECPAWTATRRKMSAEGQSSCITKGKYGFRHSVATESLTPEKSLRRQALPRTLRRAFLCQLFIRRVSDGRRTWPVGRSLTARSDRISQTIRSSFFKSDPSAFWPKSEGTKALATTHHGENQVSDTL